MLPPISIEYAGVLAGASAAASVLALSLGLHRIRPVRYLLALSALAVGASLAAWRFGPGLGRWDWAAWGVDTFFGSMLVLMPATLLLPVSAWLTRSRSVRPEPEAAPLSCDKPDTGGQVTRRRVLGGVAVALPASCASVNVAATVAAAQTPKVRPLALGIPRLPPALAGLRIAQLGDLHLGASKNLRDLERALEAISGAQPDVVVVTGDVAEDLRQLGPALSLVAQLRPRFGVYAVLGNHEYLRGIENTRPAFERADLTFLVNQHVTLDVRGASLTLAGIDDPIVDGDSNPFRAAGEHYDRAVDTALEGAPTGATRILLSHRPEGFDAAATRGIALTLAGHTHGGQLGWNGRSVLDGSARSPFRYPWGTYRKRDGAALYTTSGFGHWFPYRLGCAPEIPLFTLTALLEQGGCA